MDESRKTPPKDDLIRITQIAIAMKLHEGGKNDV